MAENPTGNGKCLLALWDLCFLFLQKPPLREHRKSEDAVGGVGSGKNIIQNIMYMYLMVGSGVLKLLVTSLANLYPYLGLDYVDCLSQSS